MKQLDVSPMRVLADASDGVVSRLNGPYDLLLTITELECMAPGNTVS